MTRRFAERLEGCTSTLSTVVDRSLATHPQAWRPYASYLLANVLFPLDQSLRWHTAHPAIWQDAESNARIHNRLGWHARAVVKGTATRDATTIAGLIDWIVEIAPHVERSNFVLTWGLRLAPERLQAAALAWLRLHPMAFQAHYLLAAWLESQRAIDDVASLVDAWAVRFPESPNLSFILCAWLNRANARHEDAVYRVSQLGRKLQVVTAAICQLTSLHSARTGPPRDIADRLFAAWLRHPSSYGRLMPSNLANTWIQNKSLVQRLIDLLIQGQLDVNVDRLAIQRFLDWVATWSEARRHDVANSIRFAGHRFHVEGLWERAL